MQLLEHQDLSVQLNSVVHSNIQRVYPADMYSLFFGCEGYVLQMSTMYLEYLYFKSIGILFANIFCSCLAVFSGFKCKSLEVLTLCIDKVDMVMPH